MRAMATGAFTSQCYSFIDSARWTVAPLELENARVRPENLKKVKKKKMGRNKKKRKQERKASQSTTVFTPKHLNIPKKVLVGFIFGVPPSACYDRYATKQYNP